MGGKLDLTTAFSFSFFGASTPAMLHIAFPCHVKGENEETLRFQVHNNCILIWEVGPARA